MRAIDEALERLGAAVGLLHPERRDPVVAPVPLARERLHREQLDAVHPELDEHRQLLGGGVERALLGEGAEVQLVEAERMQRQPAPPGVGPPERGRVVDLGLGVHPVGLSPRRGIGPDAAVLEHEGVARAGAGAGDLERVPALGVAAHREVLAAEPQLQRLRVRSPDGEANARRGDLRTMRGNHVSPKVGMGSDPVQRWRSAFVRGPRSIKGSVRESTLEDRL